MLSVICIENSYNGLIYKNGDKFISTKNIQGGYMALELKVYIIS